MKRTKIICTIGPACESKKELTEIIKAGMNIARLNFSHGTHEAHTKYIHSIREVSEKLKIPVAIMQDLQGPKIRVMALKKPLAIEAGQTIILGKDFFTDIDIIKYLKVGHRILIEDGIIELKVKSLTKRQAVLTVMNGQLIQSHKGINLPDSKVDFGSLTVKDKKDLMLGLKMGVDFVAISFVQGPKDILSLKKLIAQHIPKGEIEPRVIVKIERAEAVKNFAAILKVTDGVMVARGDLGVEIDNAQVPLVQKDIIRMCMEAAKPVIVATQMLDSMTRNPRPTRAEVSDVANAVMDGTDATMLSGETAFGKYPIEAVREMAKIITSIEKSSYVESCTFTGSHEETKAAEAGLKACTLSHEHKSPAIVSASETLFPARFLSHQRPRCTVFIATPHEKIGRQMLMYYGVQPVFVNPKHTMIELLIELIPHLKKHKLIKTGQTIIKAILHGNKSHPAFVEAEKVR